MGPTRLPIAKMMLATTSCLFVLGADSPGFAENSPGFAENSVHRDRFVESWKRQALSGKPIPIPRSRGILATVPAISGSAGCNRKRFTNNGEPSLGKPRAGDRNF